MSEKRYLLPAPAVLMLGMQETDKLISLSDGDSALLYLYLLRNGGVFNMNNACVALHRTENELKEAENKLAEAGLLCSGTESARYTAPAEEIPEYRTGDILQRVKEDGTFKGILAEAESHLGHKLSGPDMKTLFGIYDRLGLPGEVIMLLINHCSDMARKRYGEGRLPTMHFIEKEAFVWANRGIMTMEQAEEYLSAFEQRESDMGRLKSVLQISGRTPSNTERGYMESWLSMGFPMESLAVAYDRTVVGTGGKFSLKYMDTILRSWQEKGLKTPAEIEKGDSRPARSHTGRTAQNTAQPPVQDDLELWQKMMEGKA